MAGLCLYVLPGIGEEGVEDVIGNGDDGGVERNCVSIVEELDARVLPIAVEDCEVDPAFFLPLFEGRVVETERNIRFSHIGEDVEKRLLR